MRCSICFTLIRPWHPWNIDHVIPKALGGRGRGNKQPAHQLCNSIKGSRYPFSLLTDDEREAIRPFVKPKTYRRLQRIWLDDDPWFAA